MSDTDYTDLDRASLERRFGLLIDVAFPKWTERQRANFGNVITGLFCNIGDRHAYYLDKLARESRISTAHLRRSLLGMIKLIDYVAQGRSAATVDVTFTLAAVATVPATIPAGTVVKTRKTPAIKFQLLSDVSFVVGEQVKTESVEHSETHSATYASDGTPNQAIRLAHVSILVSASTPIITAGDGAYELVDSFLDSTSTDKHFMVDVDADDRGTLRFGNGTNGAIPVGTIAVEYKTGGGEEGNVEADTITSVDGNLYDDLGNLLSLTVTNVVASAGGSPRQSNASIRREAPRASRVINRAVAREDYEIVAEQVSGVSRALHLTRNEYDGIAENSGILFVMPDGGGTPSQALLDEVLEQFESTTTTPPPYPHINTFNLLVQTVAYLEIDHSVRAFKSNGTTSAQLKAAVESALETFYSSTIAASTLLQISPRVAARAGITSADGDDLVRNPLVDFGFYFKDTDGNPANQLAWSDVFNIVRDLDEVRKLDVDDGLLLNGVRADVDLVAFYFPTLGTIEIIDGDTGQTIP